jgi:hypothetical protein
MTTNILCGMPSRRRRGAPKPTMALLIETHWQEIYSFGSKIPTYICTRSSYSYTSSRHHQATAACPEGGGGSGLSPDAYRRCQASCSQLNWPRSVHEGLEPVERLRRCPASLPLWPISENPGGNAGSGDPADCLARLKLTTPWSEESLPAFRGKI